VHTSGRLASKAEIKLSFKTGGIISKILVEEGQQVSEGQVLAQLNLSEIQAKVSQAELALEKAGRDHQRVENLYNDSVTTLEQLQNVTTALEIARSNVQVARFNLKYSTITAPANGKILMRLSEANEMTGPGHPVFLFASTDKDWVVKTSITDKDIVRLNYDDSASVKFDAFPDTVFTALLIEKGTAADPYTGTYEVELKVDLDNNDKFSSGFIATVDIYSQYREKYFVVPVNALIEGYGSTGTVYITGSDSTFKKTEVRIRQINKDNMYISDGLSEGMEVITEGSAYLRPYSIIEKIN